MEEARLTLSIISAILNHMAAPSSPTIGAVHFNLDDLKVNLVGSPHVDVDPEDDPTFGVILERIRNLLNQRRIKATFFTIGRNLRSLKSCEAIQALSNEGHEIANHSTTHPYDLRRLSTDAIREEIVFFNKLCEECNLPRAVGFTAPGWNIDKKILKILIENGYKYDCSIFPSFFKGLASIYLWFFSGMQPHLWMIGGGEMLRPFTKRNSYLYQTKEGSIRLFPFPCTTFFRIPIYHTMFLMLRSPSLLKIVLKRFQATGRSLLYLFHPLDFLDPENDFKHNKSLINTLPRGNVPFKERMHLAELALDFIAANYHTDTLANIADRLHAETTTRENVPTKGMRPV